VRATVSNDGETAYAPSFIDPLAAESKQIKAKTTSGPAFIFHPSVHHLQISLGGMHCDYYEAVREAHARNTAVEEVLKIGEALSSPVVTLDAVLGMRKNLADLIIEWDTGTVSAKAGTGKNILPSCDLPNADISIATTIKGVAGARFLGTSAQLTALDGMLAQYAKMAEPLRQMYAVRMSYQAEAIDRIAELLAAARDQSDASQEAVAERADALERAHTDVVFLGAQAGALSAIFKALFLVIPGIASSKVLPQETDKTMSKAAAGLIPVAELKRLQGVHELRSEMSAASTTTSPAPASKKAKGAAAAAKVARAAGGKNKADFSRRSPGTTATGGADASAVRAAAKNRKRREKQKQKRRADADADSDDNGAGAAGPGAAGAATATTTPTTPAGGKRPARPGGSGGGSHGGGVLSADQAKGRKKPRGKDRKPSGK
jgi:hypothetical protein